jgi:hypothetical protein
MDCGSTCAVVDSVVQKFVGCPVSLPHKRQEQSIHTGDKLQEYAGQVSWARVLQVATLYWVALCKPLHWLCTGG